MSTKMNMDMNINVNATRGHRFDRACRGGYTLLFAVLTAALVLGIAVFILSISTKQYELSASARNSIASFYAADAGIECAALAYTYGAIDAEAALGGAATISCNGDTISMPNNAFIDDATGAPAILVASVKRTNFGALNFDTGNGTCANIVVYDGYDSGGTHYTFIDSRGYNKCSSTFGPDTTSSATVERALRLGKKG